MPVTEPRRPVPGPDSLSFRPVAASELAACAAVWRDSINHYTRPQGRPDIPPETAPLLRLYEHLRSTDPERFVAAFVADPAAERGERVVAFGAAVRRERLSFMSMLFVLPEMQGHGLGRAIMDLIMPPGGLTTEGPGDPLVRATATDSAQPISNALYATYGLVPRVPLLNLIGLPERPEAFGDLPSGITAVPFADVLAGAGGDGRLAAAIDALDRETLGVAHPIDHDFVRREGRRGWLYVGPDGTPVAYGYAGEAGRVGPIACRDDALLTATLGHVMQAVRPRGAFAVWLAGSADRAVVSALHAGFRLDPWPVLLCWDHPFVDLARYVPISPGLL
jgi:GNAT superfamily N-acetyltransferase